MAGDAAEELGAASHDLALRAGQLALDGRVEMSGDLALGEAIRRAVVALPATTQALLLAPAAFS